MHIWHHVCPPPSTVTNCTPYTVKNREDCTAQKRLPLQPWLNDVSWPGHATSIVRSQQETTNRRRRLDCWLSFTQRRRRIIYKACTQCNRPNYCNTTTFHTVMHWATSPTSYHTRYRPTVNTSVNICREANTDMTYFDRWVVTALISIKQRSH